MQRPFTSSMLFSSILLLAASVSAQTTVDITVPGGLVCSYNTGSVTTGPTAGHLHATASSMTGTGCGSGSGSNAPVTFGPASPLTASPSTPLPQAGGAVTFAYQPLNANSCIGTITGPSAPAFPGCSGSGCTGLVTQSVTFPSNPSNSIDATYQVSVACTGAGSTTPVVSPSGAPLQVIVLHTAATGCTAPPTILGAGSRTWTMLPSTQTVLATYGAFGNKQVNTTKFESFFNSPNTPETLWPSTYNASPTIFLPTGNYMAGAFKPKSPYFLHAPSTLYGKISVGESSFTGSISMTISTSCGDFGQLGSVVPGCYLNAGFADSFFAWHSSGATCALQDDTQYFLNVINADISQLATGGVATPTISGCTGGVCTDPLQNGIGNWSGYVP